VVEDYSHLIGMRLARSREEAHTIHAQRRHVRCSTTLLCGCRDVGLNLAKLYHSLEQSQLWSRTDKKDTAVVGARLSAWVAGMLRVWRGVDATGRSTMDLALRVYYSVSHKMRLEPRI
jgi:hypothetical protein